MAAHDDRAIDSAAKASCVCAADGSRNLHGQVTSGYPLHGLTDSVDALLGVPRAAALHDDQGGDQAHCQYTWRDEQGQHILPVVKLAQDQTIDRRDEAHNRLTELATGLGNGFPGLGSLAQLSGGIGNAINRRGHHREHTERAAQRIDGPGVADPIDTYQFFTPGQGFNDADELGSVGAEFVRGLLTVATALADPLQRRRRKAAHVPVIRAPGRPVRRTSCRWPGPPCAWPAWRGRGCRASTPWRAFSERSVA